MHEAVHGGASLGESGVLFACQLPDEGESIKGLRWLFAVFAGHGSRVS